MIAAYFVQSWSSCFLYCSIHILSSGNFVSTLSLKPARASEDSQFQRRPALHSLPGQISAGHRGGAGRKVVLHTTYICIVLAYVDKVWLPSCLVSYSSTQPFEGSHKCGACTRGVAISTSFTPTTAVPYTFSS